MADILPFRAGGVIPATVMEPDQDLIAAIEGWLIDAKSGQLRAMGYVMINRDRDIVTGWIGGADGRDMLSGVNLLTFRYMKAHQEQDD